MADNTVAIDVEVKVGDLDARLGKIEDKLGGIADEGKKVGKQVTGGFKSAGEMATTIPGPIGMAATAMASLRAMTLKFLATLKTVKGAIAATGIGALVLAVAALATYFANTERGAQKLRVIMATVGATFAVVTDRVIKLVEGFRVLFSGEFAKGFSEIKGSFVGIGEEIRNDVTAASALAEAFNALKVSQRELSVESAQRRADIKELNKLAEDVTKSFEVRAEAAQKAADIEDELLQKRLANAEENVRIIAEQNALSESTEEDLQKLADAEIKLANIRMESMELQTTIQNKLNTIKLQELAVAAAARKAEEEEAKAAAERELDLLQQNQDAKIALQQNEEYRRILEVELNLERKLAEIEEESIQATELKKNLALLADAEIIGIQEEGRQREIDILKRAADEKKAIGDKEVADVKAAEAEKQALRGASFDAASGLTSALGQLVSASGEQSKGAVALQKTIAVATIAIDTAKAVVGAIAQAQSVPYPGNLIAMATGVAAVVAGIASAVTTLNSSPMPGPSAPPPPSASSAMASASAPSIGQVNTNSTDLGNVQGAQLAPIQAFVVETEMTGNQNNINQIENQVTFGIDG